MVFYFIFARNDESAGSCVEQVRAKTSNGWGEFSESASARTYSQNDASTPSAGLYVSDAIIFGCLNVLSFTVC